MGRYPRPHLPGGTFHLTTRLHRAEALFDPQLRTAIVGLLRDQVAVGDIELLAYAIMPNHLHLVVRQGKGRLSDFMQPLLRRIALLVQRKHVRQGYVFERRYHSEPCADPGHLRNAIVYTHLNPVRANLCGLPGEYAWSSHRAWLENAPAADGAADPVTLTKSLDLFAAGPQRTRAQVRADYLAYVTWTRNYELWLREIKAGNSVGRSPPAPSVGQGDANWLLYFTPEQPDYNVPVASGEAVPAEANPSRPDLDVIAKEQLIELELGIDLTIVRSRWGGAVYVRARHAIIRRASALGYRNAQIAAYLRISASAVAEVLSADRKRFLLRQN